MESLLQDLRYGLRMLVKNPGVTIVAIIALALGIGANTAIFSVVNAVMLKPLPYRNADGLVMVWEHNRARDRRQNVISPANFLDWKDQNNVFEDMAGFFDIRANLTEVDDPEEIPGQRVTANMFSVLGAYPMLGRAFEGEDGQEGHANLVILSHGLWKRRFGGDPGVINQTIKLNGRPVTVIGVMPPDFQFFIKAGSLTGKQAEIWTPFNLGPDFRVRRGRFMSAVARLKPGVTVEQAQAEMTQIADSLEQQYPEFDKNWGVNLVPMRSQFTGEISTSLLVLFGAVVFVLLIACANVANLLLARAAARQKDIAIRAALGASRSRLVRQLLTESVLLAGLGGVLGLLVAVWGVDLLIALAPKDLPPLAGVEINYLVLGFTLAVSLLTGLIFGLVPAMEASRPNLNETLKEGGRSAASGARSHRVRSVFVVAEIAMALVLLIMSGLMIRSFARLQSVNPGFNPNNLLTVRLLLPASKYREDPQVISFFRQALTRIEAMPGVRSAGAISYLPFAAGGGAATGFTIEGQPAPAAGQKPTLDVRVCDPNYFQTMSIPFIRGRNFTEKEATEVSHVVIISEAMARDYFPNEDPIGKRVRIDMMDDPAPCEIIGVVGDSKHQGLDVEPRAMSYWPHPELTYSAMTIVARTEGDPLSYSSAVQAAVQALDKDQPIADVRTMEQWLSDSVAKPRFITLLLSVFAAVALVLAMVGIYGVMSYSVTQRTHEIGIRMALGASSTNVMRMVVRQGMVLALLGVGCGLAASFALTRVLAGFLFGVSTTDPVTFGLIAALLAGIALVACAVPARRATKVDPMIALRYE
ncbi:MAG TPA: ABC transporter permease [Blastocatellia bacterium]|nr:ABC transporter permease [Blastocatellia bacterium]